MPPGHLLQGNDPHKSVLLELGNNTPIVVDARADLAYSADKLAAAGALGASGDDVPTLLTTSTGTCNFT